MNVPTCFHARRGGNQTFRLACAQEAVGRACVLFALLLVVPTLCAIGPAESKAAFEAYNKAFYFSEGTNGYYRQTTEGGKTYFWDRAEQMEMLLDAYERGSNRVCLTLFSNLYNGFLTDHGSLWNTNEFNDDIMWMVIACARAYQHTANPAFRGAAKSNFDMCFARAWSADLGGGLWWKTDNQSKNACVNGPGAIAAALLHQISGDTNYLRKAKDMFLWEKANLFNATNGAVYDNISLRGRRLDERIYSYNLGTFAGAANLLGYTNEARLASDYAMNVLSQGGLLPPSGQRGDGGGFHGICVRWIARFMKERGYESRYGPWLRFNAEAAWKGRRADNLCWSRWDRPTPDGRLYSWACSSAVVLLQVVPPDLPQR